MFRNKYNNNKHFKKEQVLKTLKLLKMKNNNQFYKKISKKYHWEINLWLINYSMKYNKLEIKD